MLVASQVQPPISEFGPLNEWIGANFVDIRTKDRSRVQLLEQPILLLVRMTPAIHLDRILEEMQQLVLALVLVVARQALPNSKLNWSTIPLVMRLIRPATIASMKMVQETQLVQQLALILEPKLVRLLVMTQLPPLHLVTI